MFQPDQYELLDFGDGRKLERFGKFILDRPNPAAEGFRPSRTRLWQQADAKYYRNQGDRGQWQYTRELPPTWLIQHSSISLELKRTDFGHLGVFPEQAVNWDWIAQRIRAAQRPFRVLNLFSYTGGSTITAAAAGAHVVHVDAAANTVRWARRNAQLSGLAEDPIRWIVEDARTFVSRELRRGATYDGVILDPPSYGHGPKGKPWKLDQHLSNLLEGCWKLLQSSPDFLLLTCHSPGLSANQLGRTVRETLAGSNRPGRFMAADLTMTAGDGRKLPSGIVCRWCADR